MTLDNGYIPVHNFEKFKKMIDDNLGTEYEFDEPSDNELYVSGWVEAETKSEVDAYEVAFELCKGINYKDSDNIILYKNELATKNNTFLKHDDLLIDVSKLAGVFIIDKSLIMIFSNGRYIRKNGEQTSKNLFKLIVYKIIDCLKIDSRVFLVRSDFLINTRRLQSSEYRENEEVAYFTFKHGNYQCVKIKPLRYKRIQLLLIETLNNNINNILC